MKLIDTTFIIEEIKQEMRVKNEIWLNFICEDEKIEFSEKLVEKYEEICNTYNEGILCINCILEGEDCRKNFIKLIKNKKIIL